MFTVTDWLLEEKLRQAKSSWEGNHLQKSELRHSSLIVTVGKPKIDRDSARQGSSEGDYVKSSKRKDEQRGGKRKERGSSRPD